MYVCMYVCMYVSTCLSEVQCQKSFTSTTATEQATTTTPEAPINEITMLRPVCFSVIRPAVQAGRPAATCPLFSIIPTPTVQASRAMTILSKESAEEFKNQVC